MEKTKQEALDRNRSLGWWLVAMMIGLYILDQVTKLYIVYNFNRPTFVIGQGIFEYKLDTVPVIEGLLNIVRVHNTGVAFGFGNGTSWASYVFLVVPVIAIILFVFLFRKGFFNTIWLKLAWALLLVGVCGNLTDRLIQGFILKYQLSADMTLWDCIRYGYVVDFIDVKIPWIDWHWPAFNVADSCICIAAVIFLVSSFFVSSAEKGEPSEQKG